MKVILLIMISDQRAMEVNVNFTLYQAEIKENFEKSQD